MNWEALHRLSTPELRELADSLGRGRLAVGWSTAVLERQFPGSGGRLAALLSTLQREGYAAGQMAVLVDAVLAERVSGADPGRLVELVLSGPEVPGVPTADTPAQMRSLFEAAQTEVLVVGYAFYNAAPMFAPLVERMRAVPGLRVVFCLNAMAHRPATDPEQALQHFAAEFRRHHWPWPELPEVWFDPRSLSTGSERASLHAKCIVVDRRVALVTSANFTAAGQERNIEAGVLVRHAPLAERLAGYFEGLIKSAQLSRCVVAESVG
ncbi:MAG: hypothetical protein IT204_19000 [Fimbriimonadaceae bacterium]|nr:hypothetical protein [Fimbriimonadaceae bacterium]